MESGRFDAAFVIVVGHEGDYSNDRDDPGGETKYGISKRAYPDLDIRYLMECDAKLIYRRDYWTMIRGDELPPEVALLVFDAAVNNGVDRAVSWLQEAVGAAVDGEIGPQTLAAVRHTVAENGVAPLCAEFQAQRLVFMAGLPTWRTFGLGWARRLCLLPWQAMEGE